MEMVYQPGDQTSLLACYPEDLPKNVPHGINKEGMFGGWAAYSEHIFHILAAGAPMEEFSTGPIPTMP